MIELRIPDNVVSEAFQSALRMQPDKGSNFFTDLRFCLRGSLASFLTANGIPVRNEKDVGHRSRSIAEVHDTTPLRHYSSMHQQEYVLDAAFCFGYSFGDCSLSAINYVCGGTSRPSLQPFRTIRQFSIGNIALNLREHVKEISLRTDSCFRAAGIAVHNGSKKSPGPFIAFLGIHFDYDALPALLDKIVTGLPSDYHALDEVESCSTPVLWIARHTGKLFTCTCFKEFQTPNSDFSTVAGLCCLCTSRTPRAKCGHKMYYTPFQQAWNPYIAIFRSRLLKEHGERYQKSEAFTTLDRDAENLLREAIGHPRIGEKWKKETQLLHLIRVLFEPLKVIHHYKGDELFGLEYDIYIPELRLAVEYHGYQHFVSVAHWGGDSGLTKRKANDEKKKLLSNRHGIDLVEFSYKDEINADLVSHRLAPFLNRFRKSGVPPLAEHVEAERMLLFDAERGKALRKKRRRTPTLWRPHLKPDQVDLVVGLLELACAKLRSCEDLGVLIVMQRNGNNYMDRASYGTVGETITKLHNHISSDDSVQFYALAFRFALQEPDEEGPRNGLMIATERKGLLSSLFIFFELKQSEDNRLIFKDSSACYHTAGPLIRSNRFDSESATTWEWLMATKIGVIESHM